MNKAEALAVFTTMMVRELLREDETALPSHEGRLRPAPPEEGPPQPRFDFDESGDVCEHGGIWIPRATCPVHSDEAKEYVPTAEELDDITSDDSPEVLQRAARLKAQREREASNGRLFPEDLPNMKGMGPPPE